MNTVKEPAFVCPRCGAKSWNPNDALHSYCGRCHAYTGTQPHLDLDGNAKKFNLLRLQMELGLHG